MDSLLTMRLRGMVGEQFMISEYSAEARVYNQLYNLPQVLKGMEEEMDKRKAFEQKMKIGAGSENLRGPVNLGEAPVPFRSYEELQKARQARMAEAERSI